MYSTAHSCLLLIPSELAGISREYLFMSAVVDDVLSRLRASKINRKDNSLSHITEKTTLCTLSSHWGTYGCHRDSHEPCRKQPHRYLLLQ
jgi:hypothetical protein